MTNSTLPKITFEQAEDGEITRVLIDGEDATDIVFAIVDLASGSGIEGFESQTNHMTELRVRMYHYTGALMVGGFLSLSSATLRFRRRLARKMTAAQRHDVKREYQRFRPTILQQAAARLLEKELVPGKYKMDGTPMAA